MWQKEKKEIAALRRKKILITVGAVLLTLSLIGGAVYFYQWWQKNAFHQDRVEVYFEGPTEADSMQQTNTSFIIKITTVFRSKMPSWN